MQFSSRKGLNWINKHNLEQKLTRLDNEHNFQTFWTFNLYNLVILCIFIILSFIWNSSKRKIHFSQGPNLRVFYRTTRIYHTGIGKIWNYWLQTKDLERWALKLHFKTLKWLSISYWDFIKWLRTISSLISLSLMYFFHIPTLSSINVQYILKNETSRFLPDLFIIQRPLLV